MRIIKILGAVILAAAMLASCSADTSRTAVSCGNSEISTNMYHYWASTAKGNFLTTYGEISDTADFWSSEASDGITYAQYFDALVLEDVKSTAVSMMLYNDLRLSLPDSVKNGIRDDIDELCREYADGSKAELNSALAQFGANTDILYSVRLQEAKRSLVYNYYFGTGGVSPITDEMRTAFCRDSYVHFQLIFINNKYEYAKNADGSYKTDSDGSYITTEPSPEVLAEKNAAISEVRSSLASGGDFYELYDKYSELKAYEDGYYYSRSADYSSSIFWQLVDKVSAVEVGEIAYDESDYGTYIMLRLENDGSAWSDSESADFFDGFDTAVTSNAFRTLVQGYYDKITTDDSAISGCSVAAVACNYTF